MHIFKAGSKNWRNIDQKDFFLHKMKYWPVLRKIFYRIRYREGVKVRFLRNFNCFKVAVAVLSAWSHKSVGIEILHLNKYFFLTVSLRNSCSFVKITEVLLFAVSLHIEKYKLSLNQKSYTFKYKKITEINLSSALFGRTVPSFIIFSNN